MMVLKLLFFSAVLVFTFKSHGSIKKSGTVVLKKPFYLGDSETNKLKKQLIKQRFNAQTFVLSFKCDKYKKTPSSKSKTLNCIAVSVSPEEAK